MIPPKRFQVTIATDSGALVKFLAMFMADKFPDEPSIECHDTNNKETFLSDAKGNWINTDQRRDTGRIQLIENIAYAAITLEQWMSANTGTNADFPIRITADNEADSDKMAALLTDLWRSIEAFRKHERHHALKHSLPKITLRNQ